MRALLFKWFRYFVQALIFQFVLWSYLVIEIVINILDCDLSQFDIYYDLTCGIYQLLDIFILWHRALDFFVSSVMFCDFGKEVLHVHIDSTCLCKWMLEKGFGWIGTLQFNLFTVKFQIRMWAKDLYYMLVCTHLSYQKQNKKRCTNHVTRTFLPVCLMPKVLVNITNQGKAYS